MRQTLQDPLWTDITVIPNSTSLVILNSLYEWHRDNDLAYSSNREAFISELDMTKYNALEKNDVNSVSSIPS